MFAFGAGSRTCTGRNLSLIEMVKVLQCSLREFDVRLVDEGKEWKVRNMWFVQQTGLECILTPRKGVRDSDGYGCMRVFCGWEVC